MNSITIFKLIYFGMNVFLAGIYFGERYTWSTSFKDRISVIIVTILGIMFALPYLCGSFITEKIFNGVNYFKNIFQLKFWFLYYLKNEFHNLTEEELNRVNKRSIELLKKKIIFNQ